VSAFRDTVWLQWVDSASLAGQVERLFPANTGSSPGENDFSEAAVQLVS